MVPLPPDPRTHAHHPETRHAEESLRGQLEGSGWTYVTPRPVAAAARLSLRAAPRTDAAQVSEALPGEALERLWDDGHGWVYVRTGQDRYLGWTRLGGLTAPPAVKPSPSPPCAPTPSPGRRSASRLLASCAWGPG
ncbi:SH3 domain-containing protein [Deinococcus radiopugnans]|uniref:SH3 domain-containing protein n=1 Tax=Deinococcus radiopugnans TaxID=57497 RepID=UPI00360C96BD